MVTKVYKESGVYNIYFDDITGRVVSKEKAGLSKQSFPSIDLIKGNYELIDLDPPESVEVAPDVSEEELAKFGARFGYKPEEPKKELEVDNSILNKVFNSVYPKVISKFSRALAEGKKDYAAGLYDMGVLLQPDLEEIYEPLLIEYGVEL